MTNYDEKNNYFIQQPLRISCDISLESRKQYNFLLEKLIKQIIIHKRYTYEVGLNKIKELEAKTEQILKKSQKNAFYIKNKLKLSKLLEIKRFINQELNHTIKTIEYFILTNFQELDKLSQEAAYLINKKIYSKSDIISLQQLLSRDISESESCVFKKIGKAVASFEKSYIKALLYFSPKVSSDFLKSKFGITTHHTPSSISFIVMPYSCDFFLSGSIDGLIRIWNLKTRLHEFTLNGHEGPITALVLTKNGKVAISGSADKTLIIWNIEKRSLEKHIKNLPSHIKKLELSYDEKYFLSLSENGVLKWWDFETFGETDSSILSSNAIKFNLFSDRYSFILWEENRIIYKNIQEPEDNNHFILDNAKRISTLKISNNNKFILLACEKKIMHLIKSDKIWEYSYCCSHECLINDLAISFNDDFFLTTSQDCRLRYWTLSNKQCKRIFDKYDFSMSKILISRDNNIALTYSSSIGIWNIELAINEYSFEHDKFLSHEFCLSSNGKFLILGRINGSINILDVIDKSFLKIKYHSIKPHCICFSEDKTLVATGSADKTLIIWKIKTGEIVALHAKHTKSINCICINKSNSLVASGSVENVIIVCDIKQKQNLIYLYGHGVIRNLIFIDKSFFIAGSSDNVVYIWDYSLNIRDDIINILTANVDKIVVVGELLSASSKNEIIIYSINKKKVKYNVPIIQVSKIITVNRNFTTIAIGTSHNKLMLWDIKGNKYIITIKKYSIPICAVITEKNKLIIPSEKKFSLIVFDIFRNITEFILKGHKSQINALELSVDENKLASGSNDNTIIIWSLDTRSKEFVLSRYTKEISSLFFTRDNVYLASGYFDGNIKFWNLENKQLAFENYFDSPINSISMTSDNRFLFLGLQNSEVKFYDFEYSAMKILTSFKSPVKKVEVTKDDNYAIFVADGSCLKVWNIRNDCIEIVYTSKENLLNSFAIKKDNLFIYVPSNLSGIAEIKLKNDFIKNNSGFRQDKMQKDAYEIEFTDDIIYNFIKMYDAKSFQRIMNMDSKILELFSNYFYID
ncbi:hypothetical protein SteCoe_18760 [Stentor coeruleus]|uniref:Uncharacterized protein n=1 Tax=Stentor coeruleus TaxID=5963 RepID=A0A1R2BW27_9CILI|nr:hypothetical protein SteCoe_18760 [Stentor coeruleus]